MPLALVSSLSSYLAFQPIYTSTSLPTPRLPMDSPGPRLPWAVIERVIKYSRDHPRTLWSLSLTCHQLLPRTRVVMFARVRFRSREHVFAFVSFLAQNPDLMPFVRSIAIWPTDLAPVPLLRILPNLCKIRFLSHSSEFEGRAVDWPELHQFTLTYFRLLGTNIQTLHFSHLRFKTSMSFTRVLVTFGNITHLICDHGVEINEESVENLPHLSEIIKRWRSTQMLKALTVRVSLSWSESVQLLIPKLWTHCW